MDTEIPSADVFVHAVQSRLFSAYSRGCWSWVYDMYHRATATLSYEAVQPMLCSWMEPRSARIADLFGATLGLPLYMHIILEP